MSQQGPFIQTSTAECVCVRSYFSLLPGAMQEAGYDCAVEIDFNRKCYLALGDIICNYAPRPEPNLKYFSSYKCQNEWYSMW